jgi:hypothetical protein
MDVTKNRTFIHLAIGNDTGGYSAKGPNLLDTDGCPMELFQMSPHSLVLLILLIEPSLRHVAFSCFVISTTDLKAAH